jgi:hypothetical protein
MNKKRKANAPGLQSAFKLEQGQQQQSKGKAGIIQEK